MRNQLHSEIDRIEEIQEETQVEVEKAHATAKDALREMLGDLLEQTGNDHTAVTSFLLEEFRKPDGLLAGIADFIENEALASMTTESFHLGVKFAKERNGEG